MYKYVWKTFNTQSCKCKFLDIKIYSSDFHCYNKAVDNYLHTNVLKSVTISTMRQIQVHYLIVCFNPYGSKWHE